MQTLISESDRLEALESRVAFQDQTIEELNQVITNLSNQIDQLSAKVKSLSLQASSDFVSKDGDLNPPHY